eukprot:gene4299-6610_t
MSAIAYKCPWIQIGKYRLEPWSHRFEAAAPVYVCAKCLARYNTQKQLRQHANICFVKEPPGKCIFRSKAFDIYQVDGFLGRRFARALTWLTTAFITDKLLSVDVTRFEYFVLREENKFVAAYFSRQKNCPIENNLSCIAVFPQYQRQGYGKILVDLSYEISLRDGRIGTPERPLSLHGRKLYHSVWRTRLMRAMSEQKSSQVTLKSLSDSTGIDPFDIVEAIQTMGTFCDDEEGNRFILLYPDASLRTKLCQPIQDWKRLRYNHASLVALNP